MTITIREARADEIETLIPLLLAAEPSEGALRWGLANLVDATYRMDENGALVAAANVRWRGDPCEIVELAVAAERRGQGLGRRFVAWLLDEARRRGKRRMLVGVTNAALANIAFYQRCGFRMDHVRHDYFDYYERYYGGPVYENGIQVRDMLVFRYDLEDQTDASYVHRQSRRS
ncbi:MAG TPA: GNAT family N-acetyltransferase [Roseiflexaceae bacterium]|nr:GNAT family N-acetyltransferase [Roseiflexaceae bacterium]